MELTKNKAVLDWIDQQVKLTQPKEVIWIDGSEAQLEELRKEACATGEIIQAQPGEAARLLSPPHRTPATWPAWRAGPLSAAKSRRMQAPPTTGWIPRKCTPS